MRGFELKTFLCLLVDSYRYHHFISGLCLDNHHSENPGHDDVTSQINEISSRYVCLEDGPEFLSVGHVARLQSDPLGGPVGRAVDEGLGADADAVDASDAEKVTIEVVLT